jgi:hypothetical protein
MDCADAAVGLLLGTLRGGDSFRSPPRLQISAQYGFSYQFRTA